MIPASEDLLYRHVLGPSPDLDWRRLHDRAGPDKWCRMCELARIVNRFAGGYGLPLVAEGEFALRRWFANFGSPQQDSSRFEAEKNLVEVASGLDDYQGAHIELRRCLDLNDKRWRAGPWLVWALDQLCYGVLADEQVARDGDYHRLRRRHRRHRQRRRPNGAFQHSGRTPSGTPPSPTPQPAPSPPLPEHSYPEIDDVLKAMAEEGVRPPYTQSWSRTARQVTAARGVLRTEPGHSPKTLQRRWSKLGLPTQ